MLKLHSLYRPFHLKKNYKNIDEEKILSSFYTYKIGNVEEVVAHLINDAVLKHMHIYIDSTIMQVAALNEYLCGIFLDNFEAIMFNYFIYYLEAMKVEEIDEVTYNRLEHLVQTVNMKTPLEELILELEKNCKV